VIAAAAMLGYAALLLAAAPRLARAGWTDRAPRLAIAAWLALAYSAVASAVLAGLAPLIPAHRLSGPLAWLSTACEAAVNRYPGGPAATPASVLSGHACSGVPTPPVHAPPYSGV
jgi:hypothetical protein